MAPASSKAGAAGSKHSKLGTILLDDSDSDSDGGAQVEEPAGFKVNEEYARRFEHNKKREEQHRLEEKYKKETRRAGKDTNGADDDSDESSSSNETEDEEGFLATEDLDAQISATLHAIRNKDPRVYDKNVTFVQLPGDEALAADKEKKEKPVFLRDYQREKIMRGDVGASDDEEESPQTYAEEQDALKKSIVSEIHAAQHGEEESSDDDGFMRKKEPAKANAVGVHPSRATKLKLSELDIANAEKNPETFLSNFLTSRAWIPEEGGRWKAFESDDDDDNDMADEWEQAYNMRFEDPAKSNEVLKSYARDFAAARSVRREEKTGRKRQRELEREKKEEEKRQRREEKARLRKLKLEETGEKLRMVKRAAGAVGKQVKEEEWMQFLDDAWDNDKWEEEMQRRFGDDYYAMEDGAAKSDDGDQAEAGGGKKKKGPKKPRWDDDIDIKDIIPNFEDDEARPPITLSDGEDAGKPAQGGDDSGDDQDPPSKKRKTTDQKRIRLETQKAARRERTRLEALVDSKLELTNHELLSKASASSAAPATTFRYRETSPQSFGMTARDILLAPSDEALNDFAGLKKLASFRDEQKKRRDRKRLGKKARLREWRRGTFGRDFESAGPTYGFEGVMDAGAEDVGAEWSQQQRREGGGGGGGGSMAKGRVKESNREAEGQGQSNVVGDVGGARKKKRKRSKGKGAAPAEDA